LETQFRGLFELGLIPISVNITSRMQDGRVKKDAKFKTPWKNVTRANCTEYYDHRANAIAVRTGPESGILVLDIDNSEDDGKENGLKLFETWGFRHGEVQTWTAKTGKGGYHLYFRFSGDHCGYNVNNRTRLHFEDRLYGADMRGAGGVIFSPPSSYSHPDGTTLDYRWTKVMCDKPLAEVPEWLARVLKDNDHAGPSGGGSATYGRHVPAQGAACTNASWRLPGLPSAMHKCYSMHEILMCSGRQSVGLRTMLDDARCQNGAVRPEVIDEEEVQAEGSEAAVIERLMNERSQERGATVNANYEFCMQNFPLTVDELMTMLSSHPLHPDTTSLFHSMIRHNLFTFRVRGPRTCFYNVHHGGSNNFSVKVIDRNAFYFCHGTLCEKMQKQNIGRLSLKAFLEKASPNPVSIHNPSVMGLIDNPAHFAMLANYAKNETPKSAAHLFHLINKDGRVMTDDQDKFWVWSGMKYGQLSGTDARFVAAEQLEFVARAYNERVYHFNCLEKRYVEGQDWLGEEDSAVPTEREPAKRRRVAEGEAEGAGLGQKEEKKYQKIDLKKFGSSSYLDNSLKFARAIMRQVDLQSSLNDTPTLLPCRCGVINLETKVLPPAPSSLSQHEAGGCLLLSEGAQEPGVSRLHWVRVER
jgi:hypothetical protein